MLQMLNIGFSVPNVLNVKESEKKLENSVSCSNGWYTYLVAGRSLVHILTPVLPVMIKDFSAFLHCLQANYCIRNSHR